MSDAAPNPEAPASPLPAVVDEAGDTPAWLPVSGLVLFVLMALFMLWRASHPIEEPAPEGDSAAEAGDAPEVEIIPGE